MGEERKRERERTEAEMIGEEIERSWMLTGKTGGLAELCVQY